MMRFDPGAVGASGWLFLLFQGAYIPWRAWTSRARLARQEPARAAHFTGRIVTMAILFPIALGVGYLHHMELYPLAWPTASGWLQAAFTLVTMLVLVWPRWRGATTSGDRGFDVLMPSGAHEQGRWAALCALEAIVEETSYRGVMFSLLLWTSGSVAFATVVSAACYGLADAFQSRWSMAIVSIHGVLLQLLMLQSGSLYLPMLVHFLYGVIGGLVYDRLKLDGSGSPSS